jgi:hypothetical protein
LGKASKTVGWDWTKTVLLIEGELDHAPGVVGREGREDLVADAEVGVVHVRGFDGVRQAEGEAAEEGGGHGAAILAMSDGRKHEGTKDTKERREARLLGAGALGAPGLENLHRCAEARRK